jgi:glycerol-3-phosphate dehydrogenase
MVALYGSEAEIVAADGGGPAAEAAHAVLHEGALSLEDYWIRRGARAWFDPDGGLAALPMAAVAMGPLLGWSADETTRQIAACQANHDHRTAAFTPVAA